MQIRKDSLVNDQYYHVFSRSIAKFVVFNDTQEFSRMQDILKLYRYFNFDYKYSRFMKLDPDSQLKIENFLEKENSLLVEIVAYCLMPTHIHLILKQVQNKGISHFMAKILNSYSRYFNLTHKRIGPLWAGRFKSVLILTDDQLLHLTRYIHLNPTSANLVKKSEKWPFSSYQEYINRKKKGFCNFSDVVPLSASSYKKFVSDRVSYQKELSIIKRIIIDNYTG
ncbi:MAG: hypothetical protein A2Y57_00845 [Candidatus Woykebacteria bacterium RBG_13_40_7b]|uniref:Transposase IS200-like domain-containing protein n=1 Tax=Candidatus Woykebacteria bacterium RBG_13_40_7b TaxID=1802594 RepID=A0A1G1WAE7_9BACT|nr:MAG: hypothetical protein A2Y57_00845 [Candidatus Woykebacteria bacterium RBG_13_40_7b]